VEQHDPWRWGL